MSSKSSSASTLSIEEVKQDVGYIIRKHEKFKKDVGAYLKSNIELDDIRGRQIDRLYKWNAVLIFAVAVILITLIRG